MGVPSREEVGLEEGPGKVRGGWGAQFARGRGGVGAGRWRGRDGGGARRPCAPRPELWAGSPSAGLLARKAASAAAAHAVPTPARAALPPRVGSSALGWRWPQPCGGLCIPPSHCGGVPARAILFSVVLGSHAQLLSRGYPTLPPHRSPSLGASLSTQLHNWRLRQASWSPAWRAARGG